MVSSNDVQRLFLQSMLSRRVMSYKLALKVWEKCVDAVKAADDSLDIPFSADRNSWDRFVTSINALLNALNLELVTKHDEINGNEICVLVNRKDDEIAQMATDLLPAEIAFFKALVEQIMLAPNEAYCVSSMAALREVKSSNMTKAQAEVVISSFIARGYLIKSKKGRYSLTTRATVELKPYLKSTYPEETLECNECSEVVTRGVACYNPNCRIRIHTHCHRRSRRQTCPGCDINWSQEANARRLVPVGEAAFKDKQDRARRSRRDTPENHEEHNGDVVDVDEAPGPSQPTQTQRGKGKKKTVRMDVDD